MQQTRQGIRSTTKKKKLPPQPQPPRSYADIVKTQLTPPNQSPGTEMNEEAERKALEVDTPTGEVLLKSTIVVVNYT